MSDRKFYIEDLTTGEQWLPGLTWSGDRTAKALEQARKARPGIEWILREVEQGGEKQ